MNFTITLTPDENYYKEAYKEIVSSLRFKKYEPLFASIMVVLGLALYVYDTFNILGFFSLSFSAVGVFEFYKLYAQRNRWLKDRLDSKVAGQKMELEFNPETIKHKGPFSKGEIKWEGIQDIVKTKNGILLKPENGMSIYLPDRVFADKKQIEFIILKNKTTL